MSFGRVKATERSSGIPAIGGPAPAPAPKWKSPPEVIQTAVGKWWNSLSPGEHLEFTAEPEEAEPAGASALERIPNAFMKFSSGKREEVMRRNPGMKVTEVSKVIGEMWRKMSPEERAVYEGGKRRRKTRRSSPKKTGKKHVSRRRRGTRKH